MNIKAKRKEGKYPIAWQTRPASPPREKTWPKTPLTPKPEGPQTVRDRLCVRETSRDCACD